MSSDATHTSTPTGRDSDVLASQAQLRHLRLVQLQSTLNPEFLSQPERFPRSLDVAIEHELSCHLFESVLTYSVAFNVRIGNEDEPVLLIVAMYLLTFHMELEELNDAEAKRFGDQTVLLATYPYVRELVQSLTSHAGLPPLTLDLYRVTSDS